ncbi:MAG TPA: AI-2E family transporter [Solimonas sp.]
MDVSFRNQWPWYLGGLLLCVAVWLLGPILTPFIIGAALAYIGDPIVDWLQRRKLSRTLGVCVVFLVLTVVGLVAMLLLAPLLYHQAVALLKNIPDWLAWVQNTALPRLGVALPDGVHLDPEGLKQIVAEHWSKAGNVLQAIWGKVSQSSVALITAIANLLLIPVVTFYLLRDWDDLVAWVRGVIPPRKLPVVSKLAQETDEVLGGFLRGQLLLMLAQAIYYTIGLWVIGLDMALLIGMLIGLISFVPYLGAIIGLLSAAIAMLVQTQDPSSLIWLGAVFAIGQFLESNILAPWLVGDQIGLHPVAVIFAVMAGGQLFGFVGVLLALPVAAVVAVLLRHALQQWLASPLYQATDPPDAAPLILDQSETPPPP